MSLFLQKGPWSSVALCKRTATFLLGSLEPIWMHSTIRPTKHNSSVSRVAVFIFQAAMLYCRARPLLALSVKELHRRASQEWTSPPALTHVCWRKPQPQVPQFIRKNQAEMHRAEGIETLRFLLVMNCHTASTGNVGQDFIFFLQLTNGKHL